MYYVIFYIKNNSYKMTYFSLNYYRFKSDMLALQKEIIKIVENNDNI